MFRELLLLRFCQLSSGQLDQLQEHYELMIRWNEVMNLTRIEQVEDVVDRHYAESLFLGSKLPAGVVSIADVGSGAGFPGIPIAVLRPEIAVTLIESHQRKAVFLREATRELANVSVISKRAEDVDQTFDWAVSRAVSWKDVQRLTVAPRLALIGTDAPGEFMPFPWATDRGIVLVSRETRVLK